MTERLVDPLPEGSLLLHIGPQKTGSTAIQEAMHDARAALAELGVLYPGPHRRPIEAGWAVLGQGAPLGRPEPRIELWERLVEQLSGTTLPRACLSNEDLSRGSDDVVERIVGDLGAERIHLVYVARRYDRLLPSHWQERLKARMTWSYGAFLDHVLDDANEASWEWRLMWESQSVAAVLRSWGRFVPPERITVVVLDHGDHAFLPSVFEDLLDVPRGTLVAPEVVNNRSYTFPEAEALRRINQRCADEDWPHRRYLQLVRRGVAIRWTNSVRHPGDAPIPGLPDWALERVADRADRQVAEIAAAGVRVVGDPESLRVRDRLTPYDGPLELSAVRTDLVAQAVADTIERAEAMRAPAAPPAADLTTAGGRALARELARRAAARLRPREGRR
ncbi:MAG: hypothetical protein ACTHNS_05125 [Marmoricola sp.]